MAGDMEALVVVSASVIFLMAYARFAAGRIIPGPRRLFVLLPAIATIFFLPLSFSSLNLRAISGFFLTWLSVFKLLLLSFDAGPLSPSLRFLTFLPVALLPVKIRPICSSFKPPHLLPTAIKTLLLFTLIPLYSYRERFPYYFLLALYSLHVYLALELVLGFAAFIAGSLMGLDLGPQSNAPYLSTSLQDFWGRRWNLMVTSILRPSVYYPVRARLGTGAGILATFLVSGVMHELLFFYMTSAPPTGEVTSFFVLHGVCTAIEGWIKRAAKGSGRGAMRMNPVVSAALTLAFVTGTAFWLFFPPMVRNGADLRAVEEYTAALRFLLGSSEEVLAG